MNSVVIVSHSGLSVVIAWMAGILVYGLGINYTLSNWGINRQRRFLLIGCVALVFALVCLLVKNQMISLLAAVCLMAAVFPMPISPLRLFDGLGLWLPVGQAVLLAQLDPAGNFFVVLAQLWLMAGFIVLRQVYGPRYYARFGQMGFLALLLCGLCWCLLDSLWIAGLIVAGLGLAGFIFCTLKKLNPARGIYRQPLLLFDLDGTLIDSQQLVFETFRQVFAKTKPGYPLSDQELYSFFGPTLEKTFARYFPEEEVPEVIDLYQQINLDLHPKLLKEMPYAKEELQKLQEAGYTLGIVSNKRRRPVLLGMKITGLDALIPPEAVFAKEEQPACKPRPDGLIAAATQMGYPLDNVVYAGDNAADVQAARNTGFFSVGYTLDDTQYQALKNAKACVTIQDLRRLSDILKEDRIWIDKSIW